MAHCRVSHAVSPAARIDATKSTWRGTNRVPLRLFVEESTSYGKQIGNARTNSAETHPCPEGKQNHS